MNVPGTEMGRYSLVIKVFIVLMWVIMVIDGVFIRCVKYVIFFSIIFLIFKIY